MSKMPRTKRKLLLRALKRLRMALKRAREKPMSRRSSFTKLSSRKSHKTKKFLEKLRRSKRGPLSSAILKLKILRKRLLLTKRIWN